MRWFLIGINNIFICYYNRKKNEKKKTWILNPDQVMYFYVLTPLVLGYEAYMYYYSIDLKVI